MRDGDLLEVMEQPSGTKALVITGQQGHAYLLTLWMAGRVSTIEITDDLSFAEEQLNISTVNVVIVDCTVTHPVTVEAALTNIQYVKTLIAERPTIEVIIIRAAGHLMEQCCQLGICSEHKKLYCMPAPFNRDMVAETLAQRGI